MALEQVAAFGVAFDSSGAVIQVPPCGQSLGSGSSLGFGVWGLGLHLGLDLGLAFTLALFLHSLFDFTSFNFTGYSTQLMRHRAIMKASTQLIVDKQTLDGFFFCLDKLRP